MKARKKLQLTVGILTAVAAALMLLTMLLLGAVALFPQAFGSLSVFVENLVAGFHEIGALLGMTETYYVFPMIAYLLPLPLLAVGAVFMLVRRKGNAKYIFGCVLGLLGVAIPCAFSLAFANYLVGSHLVLRCVGAFLLAVYVTLVGLSLGLKDKRKVATAEEATTETATPIEIVAEPTEIVAPTETEEPTEVALFDEPTSAEQTTEQAPTEQTPSENAEPAIEQTTEFERQAPTVEEQAPAQYVPEEVSVREAVDEIYGAEKPKQVSDSKLSTLRMLLDVGAISEAEYLSLLESYLK